MRDDRTELEKMCDEVQDLLKPVGFSHESCYANGVHPATKAGRAACRKRREENA